ncbi:MAG: metal-dependent hydrolase [Methanomicrobiales archaeon]
MRAFHHLALGLLTTGLVLEPWWAVLTTLQIVALAAGVIVGSLAPDADTPGSTILRFPTRGWGLFAAPLPIFGHLVRVLVYYPLSAVCLLATGTGDHHRHRGILHSVAGAVATGVVLAACLWAAGRLAGYQLDGLALLFGSACTAGALLHLLADSATPAGVAWLQPVSSARISGRIRTDQPLLPALFAVVLALALAAVRFGRIGGWPEVPVCIGGAIVCWLSFLSLARVG